MAESFSKARHLVFFTRDKVSQDIAQRMLPDKRILLYPDIVTTLIGKYTFPSHDRKGIFLCVRHDSEKFYSNEDLKCLKEALLQYEKVYEHRKFS